MGLDRRDDDSDINEKVSEGRLGKAYKDINLEVTASLKLKKPIAQISQSVAFILNEDKTRDTEHEQIAYQYLTAKVYENRNLLGKAVVSASKSLPLTGGTMTGAVNFGDQDITNVDSLDADKLSIAGGTEMTAVKDEDNMASNSATSLATQQSIKAYVDTTHTTVQTGKNYRIINASFRDDIQTTKHYLPLKSQDEQTLLTREEGTELAVCDGRLVSATVRVENMQGTTGDFTLTMGVETNNVGSSYTTFGGTSETEALTVNTGDDHHVFHFIFSTDPHWSATDMFAVSIESSSDEWGTNERFFVTLVIEDDWSTYLAGSSREIDTTP